MKYKRITGLNATMLAGDFADNLKNSASPESKSSGMVYDSVAATNEVVNSIQGVDSLRIPQEFASLFEEIKDADRNRFIGAVLDGIEDYEFSHNQEVPPDLMEYAIHNMYCMYGEGLQKSANVLGIALDSASATSSNADSYAFGVNKLIVSTQAIFQTAIPFAHYLPADMASGESRIVLLSHNAGKKLGQYQKGENVDGINSGKTYLYSLRCTTAANAAGAHTGQLTSAMIDDRTCAPVGSGVTAVKLVKGRARVIVGGFPVARENNNLSDTEISPISGSLSLGGTSYAIAGNINVDTGAFTLTSTPHLPDNIEVLVESYLDYARDESMIPGFELSSKMYPIFAIASQGVCRVNIDANFQFNKEMGVDPQAELQYSMQMQYANERYFTALRYGYDIAKNINVDGTDISTWLATGAQTRGQSIEQITIPLGAASQKMANITNSYGISHVLCGPIVKQWLLLIQGGRFIPSGIQDYPGVHRIGTLDGKYEFYYNPRAKEITDNNGVTTAELLCAGRSRDVARSSICIGSSISPFLQPTNTGDNLSKGIAFYAKEFLEINPHKSCASGWALVTISGIK